MSLHCSFVLVCIVSLTAFSACQAPQDAAKSRIEQDLRIRSENRAKATKLYEQGLEQYRTGKTDHAAATLSNVTTMDSDNAAAWLALGIVKNDQGKLFEAAQAFEKASKLAPTRYEPYYNLGIVLETAGQFKGAIQAYNSALERAPQELQVKENLARCLISAREQLPKAKELIDEALDRELRPDWRSWLLRQSSLLVPPPTTLPAPSES